MQKVAITESVQLLLNSLLDVLLQTTLLADMSNELMVRTVCSLVVQQLRLSIRWFVITNFSVVLIATAIDVFDATNS